MTTTDKMDFFFIFVLFCLPHVSLFFVCVSLYQLGLRFSPTILTLVLTLAKAQKLELLLAQSQTLSPSTYKSVKELS